MSVLLAFSTFPDLDRARSIARTLVEEDLVACANVVPQIESIYRWQGNLEQGQEVLVLFKTTAERFESLRDRLVALHPYEVPELIAVPIAAGLPAYLDWVAGA